MLGNNIRSTVSGRRIAITDAYKKIDGYIEDMKHLRENLHKECNIIYQASFAHGTTASCATILGAVRKQIRRSNVPVQIIEDY